MFTELDSELYPDDCEVVEISPRNYFYLIQKNGSSSLRKQAIAQGSKIYRNHEISDLGDIQILVRDPVTRYQSGTNTFVNHLVRDNPALDRDTCTWMALRYRFLNRHYLPQFLWLVNLRRFMRDDCRLHLRPFESITDLATIHDRAGPRITDEMREKIQQAGINELWIYMDQILRDNLQQSFTWTQLIDLYRQKSANPLVPIEQKARTLLDALC